MYFVAFGLALAFALLSTSTAYGFEWSSLLEWEPTYDIPVLIMSDFGANNEKIDPVKQAITSDKQNKGFYGWNSALSSISKNIKKDIPLFTFTENKADAKAIIVLTKFNGPKNTEGFTQYKLIDGKINQAVVIIYNSDEIDDERLQLITRHELGHVLGLGHTVDSMDLMNPIIDYRYGLISLFDLNTLSELYMKI